MSDMEAEQNASYEFDVAVTFAGEDREFAAEVVAALKDEMSIFYDQDYLAESWGEDGVEYFTRVYQERARFALMFVSRHYADKLWTQVERRAALSRAASEKSAYVLPVQLDDTRLPGMPATTLYLDVRRLGIERLIELLRQKVKGEPMLPELSAAAVNQVPRTREAVQALIEQRPPGWEYLLWAAILKLRMDELAPKLRDHQMGFSSRTGERVAIEEVVAFAQQALSDAQRMAANLNAVLDPATQVAGFGAPGEPGDVDRIVHMAERFASVYESFLDWSASLRGCTVHNDHARAAFDALARAADGSLDNLQAFVVEVVSEFDRMPEILRQGGSVKIHRVVTLVLDSEALAQFNRELGLAVQDI